MFFSHHLFQMEASHKAKHIKWHPLTKYQLHMNGPSLIIFKELCSWEFRKWFFWINQKFQFWLQVRNLQFLIPYFRWASDCPTLNYMIFLLLSMNHFWIVYINQTLSELRNKILRLILVESFSFLEQII